MRLSESKEEPQLAENEGSAAGDLERKLATILSADVAGYSRLMAEDEEQTLRTFRGHREVFEKLVALHRDGRVDARGSFRNGRSVTLNWRKN
jgi:class 3 adenylate cyclase